MDPSLRKCRVDHLVKIARQAMWDAEEKGLNRCYVRMTPGRLHTHEHLLVAQEVGSELYPGRLKLVTEDTGLVPQENGTFVREFFQSLEIMW